MLPIALIAILPQSVDVPAPFGPQLYDVPLQLLGPRLSACDLDGDGAQEVLVCGGDGVLLHATSTAQGGLQFETASLPTIVRHAIGADLDGDGIDEIVVAGDQLFVVPNGGGFAHLGVPWAASQGKHDFVAAADLDGDGDLDLVSNWGPNLRTHVNDGSHGFQVGSYVQDLGAWSEFALGDFDGDGTPDVARLLSSKVRVRLGDGAGGWGAAKDFPLSSPQGPLRTADIDGDGVLDLVVRRMSKGVPNIHFGTGDGAFGSAVSLAGHYHDVYTYGYGLLQLDDDPASEVVVADEHGCHRIDDPTGETRVTRWPVSRTHEFVALRTGARVAPTVVGLVEVDYINAWQKIWALAVYDAGSVPDAAWFLDELGSLVQTVWAPLDADVNGDGHLDRLQNAGTSEGIVVRLGSAQGWGGGEYALDPDTQASRALDLDGDGDSDLLAAVYSGGIFHFEVHHNDGQGRFSTGVRYAPGFSPQSWPAVLGDFDGDGRDDVGAIVDGDFLVLLSLDQGNVAIGAQLAGFGLPKLVADLDLDGHLDLGFDGAPGTIALGDGQGGVRGLVPAPAVPDKPNAILAAGDLDGDGLPELVVRVGSAFQAQLAIFPGLGNATWGAPRLLGPHRKIKSAQVVDVDGDARADLILGVSGGPL
ncbi:MAG TPA: VCBS repeat-containing protein, partial [Planctomycetota bacterium]|nr:VCBS repeat-containing protein [Planctomycetota bacterium]